MSAEAQSFTTADQHIVLDIAKKFMPLTFGDGNIKPGTSNIIHFKNPSTPLKLVSNNGNEFFFCELITKIFFEQYIHFNEYLFERDTQGEQVRRTKPLVEGLEYHTERAACYIWIHQMQQFNKKGVNEIDWHVKRIKEIYGIDYSNPVIAL